MREIAGVFDFFGTKTKENESSEIWKVTPEKPVRGKPVQRSWVDRVLHRREPTAFQRCLAVHIHFAGPRGGLS